MKTVDFSSVEWGWSFWLILFFPAIVALLAGMHAASQKRNSHFPSRHLSITVLVIGALFYLLWTFHIDRIEHAKLVYFMEHQNPSTMSWSPGQIEEPVYKDWTKTGNKGFYVKEKAKDGSLYCRPPSWVLIAAPVYSALFWSAGFFLRSRRKNEGVR